MLRGWDLTPLASIAPWEGSGVMVPPIIYGMLWGAPGYMMSVGGLREGTALEEVRFTVSPSVLGLSLRLAYTGRFSLSDWVWRNKVEADRYFMSTAQNKKGRRATIEVSILDIALQRWGSA